MLVLSEDDVARLVDMSDALAAVRTAFRRVHEGTTVHLAKERAGLDGQTLHSIGAVSVTGDPADPADVWHGATVYVSGAVRSHWTLVFNGSQGLAAAVSGKLLSRLRTGAASGVSIDALVPKRPIRLACVGAGYQAWTQVVATAAVRTIDDLIVWSRTRERATEFAGRLRDELGLPARAVSDVDAAVSGADVVIAISKAREPVIHGAAVAAGAHIVLAGSSHPDRREADVAVFAAAAAVYVDDVELARTHSGDLRAAVDGGVLGWSDLRSIGSVLADPARNPRLTGPDAITVFCSHGVGSWDLELAKTACARAGREPVATASATEAAVSRQRPLG
jgi:ornithine cyclodeaminase/alanine dehydrogenase-like protein (mu-crystallin family)